LETPSDRQDDGNAVV